jgi:hypothetical protein
MVFAKNRPERRVVGTFVLAPLVLNWRDSFQKAMIRPTLFSRRRLEVRVASLAISVLPARTLRSPTAGTGTELVAHREEIEGMRRSSTFERSPVPVSRANRRAHPHFAHFPREYLKPETRWRSELNSNSRFRFLNWQTRAFRRQLQHSDESR